MSESHPSPKRSHPLEHEGRIARLEGIVEQIDVRLGRIETKVDANREALEAQIAATRAALEGKIAANADKIDETRAALEDKTDKKFESLLRWVIALQAVTWGLIGALKLFG